MSKENVVSELHKGARKNFPRREVILKGIDDLWQADLIDMQNLKRENKNYRYILVIIDAFSKFAWSVGVKTKCKTEIMEAFKKILLLGRVPSNLQTDLGKEFYNDEFTRLMKKFNINHYSTYSTKKASIVERFIRTIKNKLYKYFSLVGNYIWIGKPLKTLLHEYNNSVHRTIKLAPSKVTKFNEIFVMNNIKKSRIRHVLKKCKFNIGDIVRISKYKGSFQKGYTPNWSTELFTITKVNRSNPITYHLEDSRKQMILGSFYEQELQKTKCPNTYLIEKVIKKKGNRLYVKWLGLSDSENSWINKTAIL